MAIETFQWCGALNNPGQIRFNTRTTQMGNGYVVAAPEGLNGKSQVWPVNVTGSYDKCKAVADFLDRHGGWKSFLFTPPKLEQGYYFAPGGYDWTPLGGDNWRITVTLVQTFRP